MVSARSAQTLLLALLSLGCGHPTADTHTPEAPGPAPTQPPAVDATHAPGAQVVAQTISFADDADPEPATQIQGAPRRPPLPRFHLFGTRAGDGPN